jgi:23S rRNA pseudouridine1911/1915/1917 synthase
MTRPRRLALVTGAAHRGRRLDDVVGEWLPSALGRPLSRSLVRRLIMAGAVRVDGRPTRRPGIAVAEKRRLEAMVDPARLPSPPSPTSSPSSPLVLRVLYEDDAVVAVDKPPGVATHATADPRRPHLIGLVKSHLGTDYVGIHQRLDRDTSGIVLFAKSRAANPGLARAFAEHQVEKTYHALTARPAVDPPWRWTVRSRLAASGKRRMTAVASGGHEAETEFRLLEPLPGALLVEARPRTGRKHQIRVHLAESGLPILGDDVYGTASRDIPRLMLHAARLSLPHPVSGEPQVIESPYPADFAEVLERLRRLETGGGARITLDGPSRERGEPSKAPSPRASRK